jgi:hypothetical protein
MGFANNVFKKTAIPEREFKKARVLGFYKPSTLLLRKRQ